MPIEHRLHLYLLNQMNERTGFHASKHTSLKKLAQGKTTSQYMFQKLLHSKHTTSHSRQQGSGGADTVTIGADILGSVNTSVGWAFACAPVMETKYGGIW